MYVYRLAKNYFNLVALIFVLTGCSLTASLGLDQKSTVTSKPEFTNVTENLPATGHFDFDASGGEEPLIYSIETGDGTINPTTGDYTAGATGGAVVIKVQDAKGQESLYTVQVIPAMSLNPSTQYVIANGSSYNLKVPTGGLPPYAYTKTSGLGTVTGTTYQPSSSAGVAQISIMDSLQNIINLNLVIQEFAFYNLKQSAISGGKNSTTSVIKYVKGTDRTYSVSFVSPIKTETVNILGASKPNYIDLAYTMNEGGLWTNLPSVSFLDGYNSYPKTLLSSGSDLYLIGNTSSPYESTNQDGIVILKSSNQASTWSREVVILDLNYDFTTSDAIITNDGSILVASSKTIVGSNARGILIHRCIISTWNCSVVLNYEATDVFSRGDTGFFAKDSSGNIYFNYRFDANPSSTETRIAKSNDNGLSWNTIHLVSMSMRPAAIAVSDDGQRIISSHTIGATTSYTLVSTNGGANWNTTTGGCSGWEIREIVMAANKDALGVCGDYANNVVTVQKLTAASTVWSTSLSVATHNWAGLSFTNVGNVLVHLKNSSTSAITSRYSSDFGTSWATKGAPSNNLVTLYDAGYSSLFKTSSNTFLLTGFEGSAANDATAHVYESTDGGTNFSSILSSSGNQDKFSGINETNSGTIVVTGARSSNSWIAQRKTSSWQAVQVYTTAEVQYGVDAGPLLKNSSQALLSVNTAIDSNFYFEWFARLSTDDGATWTTVDNYSLSPGKKAFANGGTVDGNDFIVVGKAADSSENYHWIVRKYNGSTWSLLDDDPMVGYKDASANAVIKASNGTLYVAGQRTGANKVQSWIVKRKTVGGSWEVIDNFNYTADRHSYPTAITEDSLGRIFVAGVVADLNWTPTVLVRVYEDGVWKSIGQMSYDTTLNVSSLIPCFDRRVCYVANCMNGLKMKSAYIFGLNE